MHGAWCLRPAACSPHQRGRAPASLGRPRCRASDGARGQEASLTSNGHRKDQRVQDKLSSSLGPALTSPRAQASQVFCFVCHCGRLSVRRATLRASSLMFVLALPADNRISLSFESGVQVRRTSWKWRDSGGRKRNRRGSSSEAATKRPNQLAH